MLAQHVEMKWGIAKRDKLEGRVIKFEYSYLSIFHFLFSCCEQFYSVEKNKIVRLKDLSTWLRLSGRTYPIHTISYFPATC